LRDFLFSLYWCTADQMQEFERWHRMPIVDVCFLQKLAKEHYERAALIDPGASVQLVYDSFRQLLVDMDLGEENSENFTLWYATLHASDPCSNEPAVEGTSSGAADLWVKTLNRWVRDDMLEIRFAMHNIDKKVTSSYLSDVHAPVKAVSAKKTGLRNIWRGSETERSVWDNYLWDLYYQEIRTTPISLFFFNYRRMMHREWWRQVRDTVSEIQQNDLIGELLEDLYKAELPRQTSTVMSLEDAFQVDKFPVFNDVAKNW